MCGSSQGWTMTGGGYSDLDTQSLAAEKARGQEEEAAGHIVSVFRSKRVDGKWVML